MVRGSSGHGALMVRVLRDANLRTRSGPEGSSRKRALAGAAGVPGRSYRPGKRPSRPWSTTGARSPSFSCGAPGRDGGGGQAAPGAVPAVPAADPERGAGAGPRHPRADRRHPREPPAPRVPVLRARAGPARRPPRGSSRRWSTARRARRPSRAACATQCVAIREGQHLDVVEIDAASHGGVDDARELRERAPTAPAMGREKVYIIDEAQRLSREAFDALLKVFEEPPPAFGSSWRRPSRTRCRRRSSGGASGSTSAGSPWRRSRRSCEAHRRRPRAARITDSAALAIARQAEGSSRDALSLLDQASVWAARPSTTPWSSRSSARRAARCSTSSPTPSRSATRGRRSRSSTGWCRTARTSAT